MNAKTRTRNILLATLFLCGALFQGTSRPAEARGLGEIECYAVSLTTPDADLSGNPGQTVIYTLYVKNDAPAGYPDTFTASLAGAGTWTATTPNEITLNGQQTGTWTIQVTIPTIASAGEMRAITVTATSKAEPSQKASKTLTTTVNTVYGVAVSADPSAISGDTGTQVSYTVQVTNTGNTADTFDISQDTLHLWPVEIQSSIALAAGQTLPVTVKINIPSGAAGLASDEVALTVTSQGNSAKEDTLTLTTSANLVYGANLSPLQDAKVGSPQEVLVYELNLTNTGNIRTTYDLSLSENSWGTLEIPTLELDAGQSGTIRVSVTIPALTPDGTQDVTSVKVLLPGNTEATATLTTTVVAHYFYLPIIYK